MHWCPEPKATPVSASLHSNPHVAMSVEPQTLRRRRTAPRLPPLLFDDTLATLLAIRLDVVGWTAANPSWPHGVGWTAANPSWPHGVGWTAANPSRPHGAGWTAANPSWP